MNRRHGLLLPLLLLAGASPTPFASAQDIALPVDPPANADNPPVAGERLDRTGTILDNIADSGIHKRLLQALEAAGLAGSLRTTGPLTVFAPTDSAFSSTTYDSFSDLLKPENRGVLTDLLRYHVVSGLYDRAALDARIDADGDGTAYLPTLLGGRVAVRRSGREYTITDATNHTSTIVVADVYQRNGVIHVVDAVLMPEVR